MTDIDAKKIADEIKARLELRKKNGNFDTLEELMEQYFALPLPPDAERAALIERLRNRAWLIPNSDRPTERMLDEDRTIRDMDEAADMLARPHPSGVGAALIEPTPEIINAMTASITKDGVPDHDYDDDMTRAWRDGVAAARLSHPSGTGAVPVSINDDVTDDMLNAGQERLCALRNITHFDDEVQAEIYKAMRSRDPAFRPSGAGAEVLADFAWLIEAPGQKYLGVRHITTSYDFHWTADHNAALRFISREQADATMMAIRQLAPMASDLTRPYGRLTMWLLGWGGIYAHNATYADYLDMRALQDKS